jgi:hypothetical protein
VNGGLFQVADTLYAFEGMAASLGVSFYSTKSGELKKMGERKGLGYLPDLVHVGQGVFCGGSDDKFFYCGKPEDMPKWNTITSRKSPNSLTYDGKRLWVLTQGDQNLSGDEYISAFESDGKAGWVMKGEWNIASALNPDNPRVIRYDQKNNALLIRDNQRVFAVSVQN